MDALLDSRDITCRIARTFTARTGGLTLLCKKMKPTPLFAPAVQALKAALPYREVHTGVLSLICLLFRANPLGKTHISGSSLISLSSVNVLPKATLKKFFAFQQVNASKPMVHIDHFSILVLIIK